MATRYNVAGQTDLTSTSTWTDSRFGSGGSSVPGSADDVYIVNGEETLTGDIDTDTGNIYIGDQFSGSIGTSGDPTVLGCDGDVLIESSLVRNIYIGASTTHDVANLVINCPNADVYLTTTSGGDFTRVVVEACASLTIEGIVVNLHVNGGNIRPIAYNSTAITKMTVSRGRVECWRAVTTADVDNRSRVIVDETSQSSPTVGTVNITGGGMYNHRSSGTVTTANIIAGMYTPAGAAEGHTITNLNRFGPNGVSRFVKTAGNVTVTVSNDNNYGGSSDETSQSLSGIPDAI